MITYKITGRRQDKRGIDVSVQFLDKETMLQTTTFHFVNEKEIAHDLANRCQRKIEGIEYDMANPPKLELSRDSVEEKLRELKYITADESFEDLKAVSVEAK